MSPDVQIFADAPALAEAAARMVVDAAREAVGARGRFTFVLAGGETPRETYRRLGAAPLAEAMPWDRTWIFFGDERCVPPDHPASNYRMAAETLLGKVPLPPDRVVRMRGEADDPETAAAEYAKRLSEVLGTRRGELPRFDLVLLGMGLDGHTASLFPGSPALKEIFRPVVAVHAAQAVVPQRITLTFPVLNAARRVMFLVAGPEKARAAKAVLRDRTPLPAGMVAPAEGRLTWLLDEGAASLLGR